MTNARDTFSKWIVQFSTFIFIATFQLTIAYADLSVHALFTDNGVLQQNQPVPIWGTAEPMAEITVKFGAQSVQPKQLKTRLDGFAGEPRRQFRSYQLVRS